VVRFASGGSSTTRGVVMSSGLGVVSRAEILLMSSKKKRMIVNDVKYDDK